MFILIPVLLCSRDPFKKLSNEPLLCCLLAKWSCFPIPMFLHYRIYLFTKVIQLKFDQQIRAALQRGLIKEGLPKLNQSPVCTHADAKGTLRQCYEGV